MRENNQNGSVLYWVRQLCTMIHGHVLNLHVGLGLYFVFECLFRFSTFRVF